MISTSDSIATGATTLEAAIDRATAALLTAQQGDGHWVFELEADATIPAEYVLMQCYLGEPVDGDLHRKIANYLRRLQGRHGGWPLFHDGQFDMSASVKAYFALKVLGDDTNAAHMRRARESIRSRGGAGESNVFTRFTLALFGIVSWRAVPTMPVEIMLLPAAAPFHLSKISYWARTVLVPLLVLGALKRPPRQEFSLDELFVNPPETIRAARRTEHQKVGWHVLFKAIDAILQRVEPYAPATLRTRAIAKAEAFVIERLNGEAGLGAIFPAMVNAVLMFDALGYPRQHPHFVAARNAIDRLLVIHTDEAYCQPCVSPVWDTALTCHALLEVGTPPAVSAANAGLRWLEPRQIVDFEGDWAVKRPGVRPGGWAFQYANAHYPDVDDTAVVAMAMDRVQRCDGHFTFEDAIDRAREWTIGMQSSNGGWGAFDADNEHYFLNNIPFSDHGALLDPPTEDVTARCVSMLAQLNGPSHPAIAGAMRYLKSLQLDDGSWYGRWGINYIYGTWSVLSCFRMAGLGNHDPSVSKAADWLLSIQNSDGGWGEDGASYKLDYRGYEAAPSTASQSAWGLLGLMAAGCVHHKAVERGIAYLLQTQNAAGLWDEPRFTAVGFPRVFYLRYHGYPKFFPLLAIARYRNLCSGMNLPFGM